MELEMWSDIWYPLRDLLGTIHKGGSDQVAEFIGEMEAVVIGFRT